MASKKTGGKNSKCAKVESQTEVSFPRNSRRFLRSSSLTGHDDGDSGMGTSSGGPVRLRSIRHWRNTSRNTRPRSGSSDSDEDEQGSGGGRRLHYYFTGDSSCNKTQAVAGGDGDEAASSDVDDEDQQKRFDWVWDKECKSQASHVTSDEHEVHFHLEYSCGTAACRGSMEMSDGQHYWEIKMVSAVYGTDMMVGIGTKEIDFSHYAQTFCSLLGNDNNGESCGLSYTGAFHFAGSTNMFCAKFGQKDIIGVHLDMWQGTLSFYKNGQRLGVAKSGLIGKSWYPMVCSTAARSSMRLVRSISYPSSLQFMCCTVLRRHIPQEQNVLKALAFPPGLKNYLNDRLGWLLGSQVDLTANIPCHNKATQTLLTITGKLFSAGQDDTSDEV
ncbi:SPRY domain-containing SOCS box protein 3-like [Anneissia japonica]|uniref:SPRY domain-containing SOCS box protein 3-like n=1 Tax=Anneissia japonica TaxID=1529436 RepID=UPI0014256CD7|nr:SPRY domain-containing SOCS box protein 3-like [Anneissia japonica]